MIERWATQQSQQGNFDYKVTKIIEEDISGRNKSLHKRTGYSEILRAIKMKAIDFLVVEKLDRLGRDQDNNRYLVQLAEQHEVEVYEVDGGHIDRKDRGKRLSFNIKNMWAEEYSLELEEKITKKQREARVNNNKDTSSCPMLGLDAHLTKRGFYTINEAEQAIVVDIFQTFLKLGSLKLLEKHCEQKGYRTKQRLTKEKTDRDGTIMPPRLMGGEPFTSKSLRLHLTNNKYRGFGYFKDDWNQFPQLQDENRIVRWDYAHGAVINLELFNKVQELLAENELKHRKDHKDGHVYLLGGVLHAADGSRYTGESPNGGEYGYYVNRKHKIRLPKTEIEKVIANRVKSYIEDKGLLAKLIDHMLKNQETGLPKMDQEIRQLTAQIKTLERVVEGFSTRLRQAVLDNTAKLDLICETLMGEKAKAENELMALNANLRDWEGKRQNALLTFREKTVAQCMKKVLDRFDDQSTPLKKQIIQEVIPRIVYDHESRKLDYWVNPLPSCHIREEYFNYGKDGGSDGT